MTQLFSGHTLLNNHRAKIINTVSEFCETCYETVDTAHFLLHCHKFRKEREQLENRVENILNSAGLNVVADIEMAVLVAMVENAGRETQTELIGAWVEFMLFYP